MKNISIIGAGQAGLELGFMLLAEEHSITIYSDRTPEKNL
jgi:predicted dinucleotide-binding enzyme